MSKRTLIGSDHPHYRGGQTHDANGYVVLSSAAWGENKGRRQHQVVAERTIGRPLLPDEVVHHLNGDKADNRPENLAVVTRREHQRLHLGRGRLITCRKCGTAKWHSPAAEARIGKKGYACRSCGGRWA